MMMSRKDNLKFYMQLLVLMIFMMIVGCVPGRGRPPRPQPPQSQPTPTLTPSRSVETTPSLPLESTPPANNTPLTSVESGLPPNILLIIADDMGIDASPCYDQGAEKPTMPNLERLCEQGLVFEQVWATPSCSPTRATLLTGRHGFRTGIGAAIGPNTPDGGIGLDEVSIQQVLQDNTPVRYATAVIGKWHLSDRSNGDVNNPTMMSIDHYAGLLAGVHDNYNQWQRTESGATTTVTDYSTTSFTNDAIDWLGQQQQPWFLWLAYTAPHEPFHLPPAELHAHSNLADSEADISRNPLPYYLAMMESLDHELGRLLNSLPQAVRQNTVIMFVGDNGTPNRVVQSPLSPNRAKGTVFEGGVHVPLIVAGAGVSRQGERETALVNTTDFFATIAELAAAPNVNGTDSFSFAPLLKQAGQSARKIAYTEYFGAGNRRQQRNHGWAIRDDRFKLIVLDNGDRFFYDLLVDPAEQRDLLTADLDEVAAQRKKRLEEEAVRLRGD